MPGSLSKVGCFTFEQGTEVGRRKAKPDEKGAKETIYSARFIVAHFVDEVFKDEGIVGEKIYAPLPIVEADGARDNLDDPPGIVPSDHAMLAHHPLAFLD